MSSMAKFSYQRLRIEGGFDEEAKEERAFRRIRRWSRFRKFTIRKMLRVRIQGLRRFLRRRATFFTTAKVSWFKALKRLKKGQAHMNDLFGGNYLLMQVNHTPFNVEKPFKVHGLHGLPSRYSLGRIA